jgi:hypothetical protein
VGSGAGAMETSGRCRGPSQHELSSAGHEGDVGALSSTETGRQPIKERLSAVPLSPGELVAPGAKLADGEYVIPADKCAQNSRSGIEFGGFACAARLRVP